MWSSLFWFLKIHPKKCSRLKLNGRTSNWLVLYSHLFGRPLSTTKSYLGPLGESLFWLSKIQAPFCIAELNEYKWKCSNSFVWNKSFSAWDFSSKFHISLGFSYINLIRFTKTFFQKSRFLRIDFGRVRWEPKSDKYPKIIFDFPSRTPPGSRLSSSPVQLNPEH